MKKSVIIVLFWVLLLSHCIHRRMISTPTRNQAIKQYKQVKELEHVLQYTQDRRTKQYIKKKIDSINNIKNPYK
jgi:glutamine synthetase adenylyltransferase